MNYQQVLPTEQPFLFGTWNIPGAAQIVDQFEYLNMQANMQHEQPGSSNGYGSASPSGDKSPLNSLPFLGKLSSDKKQTKDGQPPKRRGPKPDSKPALTRRQELNRQAQRTHRERKELYIKALEEEVLRLKDLYRNNVQEKDRVLQENQRLKALLQQHGISYDFGETPVKFQRENSAGYGPSSSGSISGSYQPASESTGFSPPPNGMPIQMPVSHQQQYQGDMQQSQMSMAQLPSNQIDYDQTGVDFVLALERPCMDHMQYLVVRSHNPDDQDFRHPLEPADDREWDHMSGHALMATCPPYEHVKATPNEPYPLKMPELGTPDLSKLLQLSSRLPLHHGSEITPIMAWTFIYRHPRINELTAQDFERMKLDLAAKVRCYGFGAVLEEFEVRDALEAVFSEKAMPATLDSSFATQQQQIPIMA